MGRLTDVLRQVLGKPVKTQELSLSGLTMPVDVTFDAGAAMDRYACLEAEYREKYGASWWEFYKRDVLHVVVSDYDVDMYIINSAIYHGTSPGISTSSPGVYREFHEKLESRRRALYGDDYDTLRYHRDKDDKVAKLLLDDALKTGMWKELPDELQDEYHRLAGDAV